MKVAYAFVALASLATAAMGMSDFEMCPHCAVDDVGCRARCVGVPNPNTSNIGNTNTCIAHCNTINDPGMANTCMQNCIAQNFNPAVGMVAPVAPETPSTKDNAAPKEAAGPQDDAEDAMGEAVAASASSSGPATGSSGMSDEVDGPTPSANVAAPKVTSPQHSAHSSSSGAWPRATGSAASHSGHASGSASKSHHARETDDDDDDSNSASVAGVSTLFTAALAAVVAKAAF
ncbi:hypothetical protein H4R34_003571 [Dimargaris verticillata]|uniref:Uncharacterized protein n=1 Tax=Dimargaris verticillata TaxID=2761393 RepID=A0A9W8B0G2_9FUNG|nr:hypothetical protein H4R34_003571 [Dimargaris verticillata]